MPGRGRTAEIEVRCGSAVAFSRWQRRESGASMEVEHEEQRCLDSVEIPMFVHPGNQSGLARNRSISGVLEDR
jgi:hypothetical protein